MDRRDSIAQHLGVPIGRKREPVGPALDAFHARQIPVGRNVLARLRSGDTSGLKVQERLSCAELLRSNTAVRKDAFYVRLADTGVELRVFRVTKQAAHVYSSDGFTATLADELRQKSQAIRRGIRAMRVDVVSVLASEFEPEFSKVFREVADSYLDAYLSLPPSMRPSLALRLEEEWDRRTIPDFYRVLHRVRIAPRSIGTWTPYEVGALQAFYQRREALGNPLTPLDKWVLAARAAGSREQRVVDQIRQLARIDVDGSALETHRNVLLYGQPTRPQEIG